MSIPEATNRKPDLLTAVVPVDNATVVAQVAAPGGRRIVLRRTPPAAAATNNVECPNVGTVAARQACKTAAISGSGIMAAIPNLSLSCIR